MIFFTDNDGTIISSVPSSVYQGSSGANNIYLYAPFANGETVQVSFVLPNSTYTSQYVMTPITQSSDIEYAPTQTPYSGWQFTLPNNITQYYGNVTVQFYFYSATGAILATSSSQFIVARGVPIVLPDAPVDDVYQQILSLISGINSDIENGYAAARSIYPYNSSYTYGANELVFYPVSGQSGQLLMSLTASNNQPPYVNGVLNSQYWQLIVDLELLKSITDSVSQAQQAAQTAGQSATQAAQSANNAQTAEANAQVSATTAAQSATQAQASATAAGTSADNASQSSTQAAASASSAQSSATTATNQASNAEQSANTATGAANTAQNAADSASASATAAAQSEQSAATFAANAQGAASTATSQAGNAAQSASAAAQSEAQALTYAQQAQQYAQKHYEIVQTYSDLPRPGDSAYIYLVPTNSGTSGDSYSEYLWISEQNDYEFIGTTGDIDLSGYATTQSLTAETTARIQADNNLQTQITNIENGTTVVAQANNAATATDSEKLGGVSSENYAIITGTYANMTVGNATNAQNAVTADSATNAEDAAKLGGVAAEDYATNAALQAATTFSGTCSTVASTSSKTVSITGFTSSNLVNGTRITVTFTYNNTSSVPTLNVSGTGAKNIVTQTGAELTGTVGDWKAGSTLTFVYWNNEWVLQSPTLNATVNGAEYFAGDPEPTFYAPTSAGTAGYVLTSNGVGAPVWTNSAKYSTQVVNLGAGGNFLSRTIYRINNGVLSIFTGSIETPASGVVEGELGTEFANGAIALTAPTGNVGELGIYFPADDRSKVALTSRNASGGQSSFVCVIGVEV